MQASVSGTGANALLLLTLDIRLQGGCPVAPEYPLGTGRTPSIGHAAGTLPACHARGTQASNLLTRSYSICALLHGWCRSECPQRSTVVFVAVFLCCTDLPFFRIKHHRAGPDGTHSVDVALALASALALYLG
jgi:hypothetical protein